MHTIYFSVFTFSLPFSLLRKNCILPCLSWAVNLTGRQNILVNLNINVISTKKKRLSQGQMTNKISNNK